MVDVVGYWVVADEPGVHVGAAGCVEDAFCCLFFFLLAELCIYRRRDEEAFSFSSFKNLPLSTPPFPLASRLENSNSCLLLCQALVS